MFGKLKEFINKIRFYLTITNDVKKEIIANGFGVPIKLLSKGTIKYSLCPSNAPIEYCSKDCFTEVVTYLTDKNKKVKVIDIYEYRHTRKIILED